MLSTKYISILNGKQKENNLKILKTLVENGPMIVSQITKSLLPRGTGKYSKEFASLNSTIFRRVKALVEMKYLTPCRREGTVHYYLTNKSKVLAWSVWPHLRKTNLIEIMDSKKPKEYPPKYRVDLESLPPFLEVVIIRSFKDLVNSGEINLDAISDIELFNKILEKWSQSYIQLEFVEKPTKDDMQLLKELIGKEIQRLRKVVMFYEELWKGEFPNDPLPR